MLKTFLPNHGSSCTIRYKRDLTDGCWCSKLNCSLMEKPVVFNQLSCGCRYLVHCLQADLNNYMPAFLDDPEEHNPQRPKIGNIHT